MTKKKQLSPLSSAKELEKFIDLAHSLAPNNSSVQGRVIFALDATASRQATWDHACHLQNKMFQATGEVDNLALKLCYFRGFQEFQSSEWLTQARQLQEIMAQVHCVAGHTQITQVLQLALNETRLDPIQAVIFIGDSLEENANTLCKLAGELGLHKTPVFIFQEGRDVTAKRTFTTITRLSGGAYHHFNRHSSELLRQLLVAVAIFASKGRDGLQRYVEHKGNAAKNLLKQLQ